MTYAIRLTIKKGKAARKSHGIRHAHLQVYPSGMRGKRLRVAHGNMPCGREPKPITLEEATHFDTREAALAVLCDYITQTRWEDSMWVKNPQIVEVAA